MPASEARIDADSGTQQLRGHDARPLACGLLGRESAARQASVQTSSRSRRHYRAPDFLAQGL